MADDKKIIFSMVGVGKLIPPSRQILKDIYLSFFYGAKIGIIGLNGSGKSSLMKIIAGVDKDYQIRRIKSGDTLRHPLIEHNNMLSYSTRCPLLFSRIPRP